MNAISFEYSSSTADEVLSSDEEAGGAVVEVVSVRGFITLFTRAS